MAEDNNTRWGRVLAPFELPSIQPPGVKPPEQHADRSWMPTPTTGASGIDWHKDGKWRAVWKQPCDWVEKNNPAFAARLTAAEARLTTVEQREGAYSPKLAPVRREVAGLYAQLNQLFDSYTKSLPFTRY